jgi:hypothetical protein
MNREPWAIGNTFAYAIRILNCIFCRDTKHPEYTEKEKEASESIHWLVAEQINSMCSDMMIEDAQDMLVMVSSIPTNRLCEMLGCHYHHPKNPHRSSYVDVSGDKCSKCVNNKNCKIADKVDNFQIL